MFKSKKSMAIISLLVIAITFGTLLGGCSKKPSEATVVKIAIGGADTGYSPILVANDLNLLENYAPGVKLELVVVDSAVAINEAFIANQIDGGLFNLTNILVGIDRKIPYKILSSLSYGRNSIQTNAPDRIKSLADIKDDDKIAVSSTTGTGALMVYLAAEKYFGSYDALEKNMVVMGGGDASVALINKSGITFHATDITNRIKQNEARCTTILEDSDLFDGGLINTYLALTNDFYEKNPKICDALKLAMQEAIDLIMAKDERTVSSVTKWTGLDRDTYLKNMDEGCFKYVLDDFKSVERIIGISKRLELILVTPKLSEVIFDYKQ